MKRKWILKGVRYGGETHLWVLDKSTNKMVKVDTDLGLKFFSKENTN